MAYGKSNGHVADLITLKGQGRDSGMFAPNISITAGDTGSVTVKHL